VPKFLPGIAYLSTLLTALCLSACSDTPTATPASANQVAAQAGTTTDVADLPPGFTDAPPPPPTSATQVLAGGTLLTPQATPAEIADAVIVIRHGQVIAWGKRGEVAMPNDSIGFDVRGMWLQPRVPLAANQPAEFQIFDQAPADHPGAQPIGYVQADKISLPD